MALGQGLLKQARASIAADSEGIREAMAAFEAQWQSAENQEKGLKQGCPSCQKSEHLVTDVRIFLSWVCKTCCGIASQHLS
jgi:hypothetical protein